MNRFKKISKFLLRLLAFSIVLLIFLSILIQIPAVQQYLTGSLENYLQDKFQTEVEIESIRLSLPESLVLKGVYIEDEQQDTFLNVGELSINFKLNKLLRKRIQFDEIILKNGEAKILIDADSSNFDFIVNAFGGAAAKSDTTNIVKSPKKASWDLTFDNSKLELQNIDFRYKDKTALDLRTHIGKLSSSIKQIDLNEMEFQMDQLRLEHTQVDLFLGESTPDPNRKPSENTTKFIIDANTLSLEDVNFDLDLSGVELSTTVKQLDSEKAAFQLDGDDINLKLPTVQIYETDVQYDITGAAKSSGLDYNHLDLQDITADLVDFEYHNLNIDANIKELSAITNEGFKVEQLQSQFSFTKDLIKLENLIFKSDQSNLKSKSTSIQYPFLEQVNDPLSLFEIEADINADFKNSSDLAYFYPPLDSVSFFRDNRGLPLKIRTDITGSLSDLDIRSLDFDGLNMQVKAKGTIKNLNEINRTNWNINLTKFNALGNEIAQLIPENSLPEFIVLPDTIDLSGHSIGGIQSFQTQFVAQTKRKFSPITTEIKAAAVLKNILDKDSAYLDLQVDTFYTSRADILNYLPENVLPDYVNLPDYFVLSGWLKGPFSNIESNLGLLTYRNNEQNKLKAIGRISNLFTSEKPVFDLNVEGTSISQVELKELLPDSLLPAYLELPFIKNLKGFFRGDFENFTSNFELESNTGKWSIDAFLKEDTYQLDLNVDDFEAASIFTKGYLDSLIGISFLPLSVDVQFKGQGLEISDAATSDFLVTIKNAVDTTMKGLVIDGELKKQIFLAHIEADEKEIKVKADFKLDYRKASPKWDLEVFLDELDLQALYFSERPFLVNGHLKAEALGYTLDTLNGKTLLSDVGILYDNKIEQIDSLFLVANLDVTEKQIAINSDLFNAEIKGEFKIPRVAEVLQEQIFNYWKPNYSKTLIGETDDQFDFEFSLFRPEVLTMGFIPELEILAPFDLQGNYDNKTGAINVHTNIPYFSYGKSNVESLSIQAKGNEAKLDYNISFLKASIQEAVNIEDFNTFGSLADFVLENTIQIFDKEKEKRFEIKSKSDFSEESNFQISLAPQQILNYEKWEVTKSNAISLFNDELSISDWRLFNDQQAIEIQKQKTEKIKLSFNEFDLDIFSDFIKAPVEATGSLKDEKPIGLDGILNGTISITDPQEQTAITSELNIDDLIVFNALLGKLELLANTENENVIYTEVKLHGNGNDLKLEGYYDMAQKYESLDFRLDIPSLDLRAIEALTFGYLENMVGQVKGALQINGSLSQPDLNGKLNFKDAAFDIELAKARLRLGNEDVIFDANAIEFDDLKIFDAKGNKGIMSSYILTEDYRNFYLQSNIKVNNFQVLNTTAKDNDLYYGKLWVDAIVDLNGPITEPNIDVTALTSKDSDLTYVYSTVSNQVESHEGVVEFVKPETDIKLKIVNKQMEKISSGLNMKIAVKIAVNDNLNFKAITDPITGDYFEGKAKGDLTYVQFPDGKMELNGSLAIVEGKYLFTYQKILRRTFNVKPGGTMNWTGDPFNPKMNFEVLYTVKTSPYPLLASGSDTDQTSSQKQTFFVKLNIGGTLEKSEITTSIEYPEGHGNSSDGEVSEVINRINQDVNQQNTQAFSLILFNGFLTNDLENSDFKIIDLTGNINNLITSQLNNIANRYIKFVELDFGLDKNNQETTDFRVSIRKRFLNDRLTISLDGKSTSESGREEGASQNYLDNITIEYALTPDGRFKVKVYNSREYDDFIGGTGIKIGGAFVFSKDFNGVRLFK